MKVVKLLSTRFITTGPKFQNRFSEQTSQLTKSNLERKSTIDLVSVTHHSKLCNKWWDVNGELRVLHSLNPLRVQFVRDGLANTGVQAENPCSPLEGIKVLDVGCGGGLFSEPLARIGADVTGIDASLELIATAKEHATLDPSLDGKLNYVQTVIEDFSVDNREAFNAVVASEIIEHVNDKDLFVKCCVDTLKPGGSIFVTTFNKTLNSWIAGIIAAEHILKLIPKGTHDWNKFITPAEMQSLLEKHGCKTQLIHGIGYNPLKNECFWMNSTQINYGLHAVKRKEQK